MPQKHFQADPWILWKACATLHNPPFLFAPGKESGQEEYMWSLAPVGTQMCIADLASLLLVPLTLLFQAFEIFNSRVSSGSFFIKSFITVTMDQMINIFCLSLLVEMSSPQVVGLVLGEDNK